MRQPHQAPRSADGYFGQERPEILEQVPSGVRSVLDVGCGEGGVGKRVLELGLAVHVDGIELDPAAAAVAGERLRTVVVADLNRSRVVDLIELEQAYDVVIAADVLEHVMDPWQVARDLRTVMDDGATLIVSIPNVRYLPVLVPLVLHGEWRYRDSGVLDRTHLRFFTRSTGVDLIREAGFDVIEARRATAHWRTGWKRRLGGILGDFAAEQFILVARKPAAPALR